MAGETRPTSKQVAVLDSHMHFEEHGTGDPIVFLHGNPTSSFLWRNVLPELVPLGRCLALDLIGFGRSGKPDIPYRFFDHIRYVEQWFDALALERVTLVGHDWGGALAFDWASRHPDRVRAIAFMETYVRPQTWDEWQPPEARHLFQAFRSPAGEQLILDHNAFVEVVLPAGTCASCPMRSWTLTGRPFSNETLASPCWRSQETCQ